MKILHVDTARGWRGGQNQVLLTALGMAARGHGVALACRSGGALETRARAAGLEVHALPFRGDLSPRAMLAFRGLTNRWRPDVVQLHDPHALLPGLVSGAKRRIATRRVDFPLRGPLSRMKYAACETTLAVSRCIAAVLAKSGLPADRIRVVYEGVPDRPATPGGRDALRAMGAPDDALSIGNVAALEDHKDHATLLRALALAIPAAPRLFLFVMGDGAERERLEALAGDLGIAARVRFTGFREDVDRLLPAFDIFCLSSHMEGLGTSLLDAMCFARPIVATAAGGIPEAVEDGVNGRLVEPRAPDALARALVEVAAREDVRQRFGAAGRRIFEARFSAERMVDETLRAYAESAASVSRVRASSERNSS
jgi:glycosyltransferase involved in cell wall biosynthesis